MILFTEAGKVSRSTEYAL